MPGIRFWFICLRAFVVAFAGAITTQLVKSSGSLASVDQTTWFVAGLVGLVAAFNAGHVAWPEPPPPAPPPPPARHPRERVPI